VAAKIGSWIWTPITGSRCSTCNNMRLKEGVFPEEYEGISRNSLKLQSLLSLEKHRKSPRRIVLTTHLWTGNICAFSAGKEFKPPELNGNQVAADTMLAAARKPSKSGGFKTGDTTACRWSSWLAPDYQSGKVVPAGASLAIPSPRFG
jgi:hypothetical protein